MLYASKNCVFCASYLHFHVHTIRACHNINSYIQESTYVIVILHTAVIFVIFHQHSKVRHYQRFLQIRVTHMCKYIHYTYTVCMYI